MHKYVKTFERRAYGEPPKVEVHLVGHPNDMTLCGFDISGDALIHASEPEFLPEGKRHKVTCPDCQCLIDIVREHLKLK